MLIGIQFTGNLAEKHRIPAYAGTKSLEGISHSILIISTYLIEGRVRRRKFENVPISFDIIAHRQGSFETIYDIAYAGAVIGGSVLGGAVGGATKDLLQDLIKSTFKRVIGVEKTDDIPESVAALEESKSGDIAALVEAIEPAIRDSHTVINQGAMNININIQSPHKTENIVKYSPTSKQFLLENTINDEVRTKLFSIGSFNGNQGTGRAFDLEEGRSVPFELAKGVDPKTINTLLSSISSYTRIRRLGHNLNSAIALKYTSIDASDGRLKKIRILKARTEFIDL